MNQDKKTDNSKVKKDTPKKSRKLVGEKDLSQRDMVTGKKMEDV
mgnify:CR=1 FL=1